MNTIIKNFGFRTGLYSTILSLVFMINTGHVVKASQIYIDIIPDTVISTPGDYYLLDLNNDGVNDYKISISYLAAMDMHNIGIQGLHDSSYVAWYSIEGCVYAKAFSPGDSITSATPWKTGGATVATNGGITTCMHSGSFIWQTDKCLGLKLISGGTTYYGWLRIDVGNFAQWFKLKDYCFDSGPIASGLSCGSSPVLVSDPADGKYCANAVLPGVTLMLVTSEVEVNYELFRNGETTGILVSGTGSEIIIGTLFTSGSYFVKAYYWNCTLTSNNIVITEIIPPVANFSVPPNLENTCANFQIPFNDLSTSAYSIISWSWNFGDTLSGGKNISAIQNPVHLFEAIGNSIQSFTVTLAVSDNMGCTSTHADQVTLKQKPDATLTELINPPPANGNPRAFHACNGVPANFLFSNASSTATTNTWYELLFCPGPTPNYFSSATFSTPLQVVYPAMGSYGMKYNVTGSNGCVNTKIYSINIADSIQGNIYVLPDNLYGTAPYEVTFYFSPEIVNNPPTTVYTLDFGYNTTTAFFQSNVPPNLQISYTYNIASNVQHPECCNKYGFKASFCAMNACDTVKTDICPIIVSGRSNSYINSGYWPWITGIPNQYGSGWFPGDPEAGNHLFGCNTVTFNNATAPGFYIPPDGTNPTTDTFYQWDFGDGTPFSTEMNPTHTFPVAGQTYTVTLTSYTGISPTVNSGFSVVSKQIYIQTPPTANFNTDYQPFSSTGTCSPLVVKVANLSDEGGLGIPQYQWRVLHANTGLPVNSGYSIITPGHAGDANNPDPWFQFTMQGSYQLELTLTNTCGSSVKLSDVIIVCEPPSVFFSTADVYICDPGSLVVCPAYNPNCDTGFVTYTWTVPAGVMFAAGSSASSPCPELIFPAIGVYPVTVTITNLCGSASASQYIHVTGSIFNIYELIPQDTVCPGEEVILSGSDTGVVYTLLFNCIHPMKSMTGTGGPLNFGYVRYPTTYCIQAGTGPWWYPCETTMMSGTLTVKQGPVQYIVHPYYSWGNNCPGADIFMTGSEVGVNYSLHRPDGLISELPGTGGLLSWGPQYMPGEYYVTGYMVTTQCTDTMVNRPWIVQNPMVFNVMPTGITCEPAQIGLESAEPGVTYELIQEDGSPLNPPVMYVSSSSAPFWFPGVYPAGSYRVRAYTSFSCDTLMNGTVFVAPAPVVDAGSDLTVCPGFPAHLFGSVSAGANDGYWSGGLGDFIPSRYALHAMYYPDSTELGSTVPLTLTSSNSAYCPNESDVVNVTVVGNLLSGTAGENQTVCAGQVPSPVSVTPPSGGSGSYTYLWQIQSGAAWNTISGATGMTFAPPVLNVSSKFRVIQTDFYCSPPRQVISNEVIVTMVSYPASGFTVTSSGNCPGSWIVQNASQSGILYELYRDGNPAGVNRIGPGPLDFGPQSVPGTYTVKATTPGSGCAAWMNGSPVIVPEVVPANAGPIAGPATICKGAGQIPYQVAPITGATDYIWIMPSGATIESGAHTSQIRVRFQPNYTSGNILVYGMNECAAGQFSMLPVVGKTLTGTLTLAGDTVKSGDSFCYAKEEIWTGNIPAPYLIEPGGSVSLSTMKAVHLLPGTIVREGGYLSAITTMCLPCSSQKIVAAENPYQTELRTDEYQIVENPDREMVIFPNPSDGVVFVMFPGVPAGEEVRVEVSGMHGQKLFSETIVNEKVNRLPHFESPPGIYIIRCISSSLGIATGMAVIR